MLHRLCGPPSIPLSFNLAIVLPRWNTYCVSCGTQGVSPRTPSIHRLQRGLPGYLILFAPHTFVSQRQLSSSKPPSPPVFLPISTHFTATLGIPFTSPTLKGNSFKRKLRVEPVISTPDLPLRYSRRVVSNAVHELSPWISHLTCPPGYTPFTPSKSGQRLPPTYYRGCWHVVSRGFLTGTVISFVPVV